MFKTLIFLIILGFVILLIYSGIKIMSSLQLKNNNSSKDNTPDDIETLINEIKIKILRSEINQRTGIEGAERDLTYWKDQLKITEQLKEKTKNL
jgi:hypothetical protein